VVIHPLTDDRRILPIERTGETLSAPKEFMLVVSYNPGYQNLFKGLKPSTRQRFVALSFNYPELSVETDVVATEAGIDTKTARQLVEMAHSLRALRDVDLEESASTRLLVYAASLMRQGLTFGVACEVALVEALTDDDETKVVLRDVVQAFINEAEVVPHDQPIN